ncbi:MAG: CRTAC1 family protein [Thermoanaerobaculia bacterium]|nr:CRTAC1 family protein [Thermoanaerobaculia bacterium]
MHCSIARWLRGTYGAAAWLALALSLVACAESSRENVSSEPAEARVTSVETQRMVDRLAGLAADETLLRNPFESEARAIDLERKPRPSARGARLDADVRLAREWLNAGQSERAIQRLTGVIKNLGSADQSGSLERRILSLLAVAYLRLGEQQNCIEHHHAASCLVPIREEGRHTLRDGSERAFELYLQLLRDDPSDLSARWLLNLAAMTLGDYPDGVPPEFLVAPEKFESESPQPGFRDVAGMVGAASMGLAGGVVMEDLDGDGLLDLLVSSWGTRDPLRLFVNTGRGEFEDRTSHSGLAGIVGGLNLNHADYDNDGDVDVLVLRGAWLGPYGRQPNSLLRNRGDGTFDDVTESAGLLSFRPTQAAAWADFDRDGWLDLFVGNESSSGGHHPSALYRNQGDGSFREIASASGLEVVAFVKGVTWGDIDNDSWPDLYLSTMGGPNLLFRNLGEASESGWQFEDVTENAGVGEPVYGFPTWFWDYDQDGWQDLLAFGYGSSYVGPMAAQVAADYLDVSEEIASPRLYRNQGDGTFLDVTEATGLRRSLMAMGANHGDLDYDGYPDFYVGTGAPDFTAVAPNRMFRNHSGIRFDDVTTAGGFGHIQKGHGVAFGDWDQDGDQDVYAVMGGAFSGDTYANALFQNPGFQHPEDHRWIGLLLEGTDSNRSAIGARVEVRIRTRSGSRSFFSTVSTGSSFGSSSLRREIGLGTAEEVVWLEVAWPNDDSPRRYDGFELNSYYLLREGDPAPLPLRRETLTRSAASQTVVATRPDR